MFNLYSLHKLLVFILLIHSFSVNATESIADALDYTGEQANLYLEQNINLKGALKLHKKSSSGKALMEFSGIAWDEDNAILYALSDRSYITHLRPVFENDKLIDVQLLAYYPLQDKKGKPVRYKFSDSEGLALINSSNGIADDTQLIVSYERRSRIIRYSVDGVWQASIPLPNHLSDISYFQSENKSFEAITEHSQYDFLVGSERPLENKTTNLFAIPKLHEWSFIPENEEYGSLVGLTTLGNGDVIALERSFPGIFAGITNTIHLLKFNQHQLIQDKLAQFRPTNQLFNDNFEGIAWHKGNHFFMISDDNDNALQRSLLIYFSIEGLEEHLSN